MEQEVFYDTALPAEEADHWKENFPWKYVRFYRKDVSWLESEGEWEHDRGAPSEGILSFNRQNCECSYNSGLCAWGTSVDSHNPGTGT